MTFEIIVGVLALAIAVGQVYSAQQDERRKTISIASAACALIIVVWAFKSAIDVVIWNGVLNERANKIYSALDRPKTIEEVTRAADLGDIDKYNETLHWMQDRYMVQNEVVTLTGSDGQTHFVRLYRRPK